MSNGSLTIFIGDWEDSSSGKALAVEVRGHKFKLEKPDMVSSL